MVDHADGRQPLDEDESGPLHAGLRAAFGPDSTEAVWRDGGVLAALHASSGVSSRILLRDEPGEPAGVVNPRSPEAGAMARGAGRYQVAGEIARGGVGVVLRGRDVDLGRDVAMKMLRTEYAGDPNMVRRLIEEAQIGGQLQHPGVLPVYEMGLDSSSRPYFTMKLVRGRTLSAQLQARADPHEERPRFLRIFEQVCQTVAYAHARGVVHRDLKPSNVMVGAFGEVQVVDWGLAKVFPIGGVADERKPDSEPAEAIEFATVRPAAHGSRSEVGSILGTPAYMAPEQARGEVEDLDERCDVFALGAILSEILTGDPPYIGTRVEILRMAAEGRLEEAFSRLGSIDADAELVQIARRCLSADRLARPRDAGAVASEITAYLASVDERARSSAVAAARASAQAQSERRVKYFGLGLAGALAAALALGVVLLLSERDRRARLESAVSVFLALDGKGRWVLAQANHVPDDEVGRWAQLLTFTRAAAERAASGAPDEQTRRRALELVDDLRRQEEDFRKRVDRINAQQKSSGGGETRLSAPH
jgi:eukaryotic-like serine/threonine-protein kinase